MGSGGGEGIEREEDRGGKGVAGRVQLCRHGGCRPEGGRGSDRGVHLEAAVGILDLWGDVEAGAADVLRLDLTHQSPGVALDLVFRKNKAIVGGIPWNSFVLMEFEDVGGVAEVAALLVAPVVLDLAELVECFLELAGEAGAVESEHGEGLDGGLRVGERVGVREDPGFDEWDAVEAPGGIGEFLDELGFGGVGGLIFVAELAAVSLECGGVFGGEDSGFSRESMAEGVESHTLLSGCGAWTGGVLGVGAIYGGAVGGDVVELDCCWGRHCWMDSFAYEIARGWSEPTGGGLEVIDGNEDLGGEGG